ncbi:hypothetical protein TNCV_2707611 [Trichonephila clavipes]|nr:hypothetical protein TNCV_2707611 [Trichonephila clavipes]
MPDIIFWEYTCTGLALLLTRPAHSAVIPEWMVTTCSNALDSMNTCQSVLGGSVPNEGALLMPWEGYSSDISPLKTQGHGLLRDCSVTALQLMGSLMCDIDVKQHGITCQYCLPSLVRSDA